MAYHWAKGVQKQSVHFHRCHYVLGNKKLIKKNKMEKNNNHLLFWNITIEKTYVKYAVLSFSDISNFLGILQ